ncbi:hypothetical protein SETIT_4G109500v2 [Setaria italica]|uniref:Reverse transcriptase zinc-binding domain-containing protein n=1 Tax=Setaria italica TaxID=4555 RepID=A0A368QT02_SETIT|nr:hypothetical protein SETIT_4G109500v2 [Setaria italica]
MALKSYTYDMCILQRPETSAHLFLRCNFTKACWASIGISVVTTISVLQIFSRIKQQPGVPFFMEIIILMAWSIWTTGSDVIFNDIDPSMNACKRKFVSKFSLVLLSTKPSLVPAMESWLNSL